MPGHGGSGAVDYSGVDLRNWLKEMLDRSRRAMSCPLLSWHGCSDRFFIVWGKDDDRFQPIAEAKNKAALMRSTNFEVVPGGHEPWLDGLECG